MTKPLPGEVTTVDSIDIKAQLPMPIITSTPQHVTKSEKPVNSPLLDRARKIRARASPSPNRHNKSLRFTKKINSPQVIRVNDGKISKIGLHRKKQFQKLKMPNLSREQYNSILEQYQSNKIQRQQTIQAVQPTVTIDLTSDNDSKELEKSTHALLKPKPVDLVKEKLSVIQVMEEKSRQTPTAIASASCVVSSRREADREIAELEEQLSKLHHDTHQKRDKLLTRFRFNLEEIRKTLPKITQLPTPPDQLDAEVIAAVNDIWRSGAAGQVAGRYERNECTRGDLRTLQGTQWLNDEVMNFYYQLIAGRSKTNDSLPTCHAFNTFFYQKLQQQGHSGVKRWTRKIDIFDVDRIVIPIHLGVHWTCAALLMEQKKVIYLDSMGGKNEDCRRTLLDYLRKEHKLRKGAELPDGWTDASLSDAIPQQDNGSDCGVFSCTFANYIALGHDQPEQFNFGAEHMRNYRRLMCYHITRGALPQPE